MRLLPLLLAFPLLTTFAPKSLARPAETPAVLRLVAEPVALREGAPGERRLGALRFLEGWWLRSNDPRFGGISAMNVEGRAVTALTDGGRLYVFELPERRGSFPLGSLWLPGAGGDRKKMRDSEAMAVHGEQAWVSFERHNGVRRYDRRSWRALATARPGEMRLWPKNAGAEAMVRLSDGRFLIFSEGRRGEDGSTEVVLFEGDPADPQTRSHRLRYRAPAGFRITDAAQLPDGRLLFLNRRISIFDGILAKLTIADRPDIRPGAVLGGRELAHFGGEVTTDNYEALSITREGPRTIVWIASDDNYMAFQKTLLMKFALAD